MKRIKYYLRYIPDSVFLRMMYLYRMGCVLHLKHPKTFNEKMQWMKLYIKKTKSPIYIKMVDKILAKEYVASIIGEEYIIPTLYVYKSVDEIDFKKLPDQFVLKCNHDSGGLVICKDKKNFDFSKAKKIISDCMDNNFYYHCREWQYKNIKPLIFAEKYMEDESGYELKDYKFFCFNGKVKCLKVDFGRFQEHHANYYDRKLNILPFGEAKLPPVPNHIINFPQNIEEMFSLAEKLAQGLIFVRVDLYNIRGTVYFGELTLCPASGMGKFTDENWDYILGEWLNLPNAYK